MQFTPKKDTHPSVSTRAETTEVPDIWTALDYETFVAGLWHGGAKSTRKAIEDLARAWDPKFGDVCMYLHIDDWSAYQNAVTSAFNRNFTEGMSEESSKVSAQPRELYVRDLDKIEDDIEAGRNVDVSTLAIQYSMAYDDVAAMPMSGYLPRKVKADPAMGKLLKALSATTKESPDPSDSEQM